MQKLIEGLKQFMHTVQAEEAQLFEQLAHSQNPGVLFVTCSDSRVVPHLMTGSDPGDLFVIRNAGNIIPLPGPVVTGEAATLEYAVDALGVEHIVVCGHSNCGAMKGLLDVAALEDALPTVRQWLSHCEPTRRIIETQYADLEGSARLDRAIELNVLAQLDHLRCHPGVAARLHRGDLQLHGWVYDIPSGRVRAFDSERASFAVINATEGKARPQQSASSSVA
jgi:carbonic anhydrase